MSPLDTDVVRRKLAVIVRNLDALAAIEGLPAAEYRNDTFRRKGTERLLQEIVEAAVDTNLHILRDAGVGTPPTYYESFLDVGRAGVVPRELAESLAPAAGLRNRLVHEYDRIDDALVLQAVGKARRAFAAYVAAIENHLAGK